MAKPLWSTLHFCRIVCLYYLFIFSKSNKCIIVFSGHSKLCTTCYQVPARRLRSVGNTLYKYWTQNFEGEIQTPKCESICTGEQWEASIRRKQIIMYWNNSSRRVYYATHWQVSSSVGIAPYYLTRDICIYKWSELESLGRPATKTNVRTWNEW